VANPSELAGVRRSLQEHARMVELEQESPRRAYLASIQTLMEVLEARDPSTRGHTERVRAWAIQIARKLGLPASQIKMLGMAARLHDIGKVGIRDAILEKPEPLSAEEWQVKRRHTLVGVAILQPIQFLRFALPVVRGHH
jgi:putative two-component system response regulator